MSGPSDQAQRDGIWSPRSFARASALRALGAGRYAGRIEEAWFQGPGAYGGLVAALLMRACRGEVQEEARLPRSFHVAFEAAAPGGEVEVGARVVRAGRRASFVSAELRVGDRGEVVAQADGLFSLPRPLDMDFAEEQLRTPDGGSVRRPEDCEPWPLSSDLPDFTHQFEYRQAFGARPYGGGARAAIGGWIRPRLAEPLDHCLALGLIDAWPPALLSRVDGFRPAGTATLYVEFLAELPQAGLDPAQPLLVGVQSETTFQGYSSEDDTLWTPDGRLLARARQLVALMR